MPFQKTRRGVSHGILPGIHRFVTTTQPLTLTDDNEIVLVDTTSGNITITLPAVDKSGHIAYTIKKMVAANTVTIATPGSETIDGSAEYTLNNIYESVTLLSDESNWHIQIQPSDVSSIFSTENTWTADQTFNDFVKLVLGTGGDASFYYDPDWNSVYLENTGAGGTFTDFWVEANVLPWNNNAWDLGSTSYNWRDIHLSRSILPSAAVSDLGSSSKGFREIFLDNNSGTIIDVPDAVDASGVTDYTQLIGGGGASLGARSWYRFEMADVGLGAAANSGNNLLFNLGDYALAAGTQNQAIFRSGALGTVIDLTIQIGNTGLGAETVFEHTASSSVNQKLTFRQTTGALLFDNTSTRGSLQDGIAFTSAAGTAIRFNADGTDRNVDIYAHDDFGNKYLYMDAAMFSAMGAIGLGAAAVNTAFVSVIPDTIAVPTGVDHATMHINPTETAVASGTSVNVGSLLVDDPTITGAGAVTNGFLAKFQNPPTEGTSNYGIWAAGSTRLEGELYIQGTHTETLAAHQNNFDTNGASFLILDTSGNNNYNITGFERTDAGGIGDSTGTGKFLVMINVDSSNYIQLMDLDSNSATDNQIVVGEGSGGSQNLRIAGGGNAAILWYDVAGVGGVGKWRVLAHTGGTIA